MVADALAQSEASGQIEASIQAEISDILGAYRLGLDPRIHQPILPLPPPPLPRLHPEVEQTHPHDQHRDPVAYGCAKAWKPLVLKSRRLDRSKAPPASQQQAQQLPPPPPQQQQQQQHNLRRHHCSVVAPLGELSQASNLLFASLLTHKWTCTGERLATTLLSGHTRMHTHTHIHTVYD